MDPNIITIDSDDSNDTNQLPLKNNQTSLVIVHRVINTNCPNNRNNNYSNLDMVKHCSVDQHVLQNNKHFNLNLPKEHEIITQKNEIKMKSNSSILESQLSKCTEIIDVENYKNESNASNKIPIPTVKALHNNEMLNLNGFKNHRKNIMYKNQTFNNKEIINLCSEKEPIRPTSNFLQVSDKRNMNPSQNYEQSITWPHNNSTNFMKQSMNSVMQSNKLVLLQNPPTAHQSSIPRHHLSNNQEFLQKNMYKTTEIRNAQPIYHSPAYSYINNSNYFQPGYYNNGIMMNSYVPNNNFWMRVKVEEIPEGGEVVAQYFYNNETQTPVTIENHFQVNTIPSNSNSQFIDISSLPNITSFKPLDNKLDIKNNGNVDDKNSKNCVPQLSKRTQQNNMISCDNKGISNANNYNNVNDKDVIFVGEFKQNTNIDNTNKCTESNELTKTKNSININMKNDEAKQIKKRLRKNYDTIEPRRNPKRQVQVNKEFTKLIDDILWNDVEKENKMRKTGSKTNKERLEKKPIRFSPRVHTTCGAVYSPPSPLSADHIRKWPTEGMHEKPEYNPQTGEIEPFDYVTRNITNSYNTKVNSEEKCTENYVTEDSNKKTEKCESINVLSHEMLHHMISYVATVLQMKNCASDNKITNKENKVHFFNDLGLTENDSGLVEENCDNVKDVMKNIIHEKDDNEDNDKHKLKELLKHTMLMYCITNDVSQSDLIKYIDSLKPEDIISISNEQFGLSNKSFS